MYTELHKEQRGCISELKAQVYFMEQGYDVFSPVSMLTRADFIAIDRETNDLLRVQVKTAQTNGDYLQARLTVKDRPYTSEEIDTFVFVYEDRMWIVPQFELEELTTINFGRVDKEVKNKRKPQFDTTEYEIH